LYSKQIVRQNNVRKEQTDKDNRAYIYMDVRVDGALELAAGGAFFEIGGN
jgi:hypothetical protein